jgi:peptide/nickel transport system permease protein
MRRMKNPFIALLFFLLILLIVSFTYSAFFQEDVEPVRIKYNDRGEVLGKAPFPPSLEHPLGTDKVGNDLALRMIEGAKYTIIFITGVTLTRILISLGFTYLLIFPLRRVSDWFQVIFMPFQYVPGFILVMVLSINTELLREQMGFWNLVYYQFIIFVLIGIPVLSIAFTNEAKKVLENEFIAASYQLGASKHHVFFRHIIPILINRLIVTFNQQLTANVLLLIQLGVFQYYIGGYRPGNIAAEGEVKKKYLSESGEWAGMIGQSKDEFLTNPWVFFGPLIVTFLFLIVINLITRKKDSTI